MNLSERGSSSSSPQSYEFGEFSLDPLKRLLRRNGVALPLAPKVFDTLLYLVQHGGAILDKDRLMKAVWPDVVVEENNLNQNISALRRVLGETPGSHHYIVTVPGHGYRFVAEVLSQTRPSSSEASSIKMIAVLPFKPLLATDRDAALEMGMADTLIAKLSGIRNVIVRPLSSVRKYSELEQEPLAAGRELGVDAVLDGSIQRSGDDIRVTVRLMDVSSGESLWAGTFDEKLTGIFAMQDAISERAANALTLRLTSAEKAGLTKRYTKNTEAYQFYLKGRYFWWKTTPEAYRKSCQYFERAVEADPSYALGHCGVSSYYGFGSAWGMLPPELGWPRAIAANNKALELDDTLVEVHNDLGAINMVCHRDWTKAEKEIRRAIAINPNYEEVHYLYSFYLIAMGRIDEAIAEGQRALELDPFSLRINQHLGNSFYHARRYDEAIAQYQQAAELDFNNPAVHESLGDAFEQKGLLDEAVTEWHKAMKLVGDNELAETLSGTFAQGDFVRALRAVSRKKLARLQGQTKRGEYVPAIQYVRAYRRLGDEDETFKWLRQACDERNVFALLIKSDPLYDNLRSDPRFANCQST